MYLDKIYNLQQATSPSGTMKIYENMNDAREALDVLGVHVDGMNELFVYNMVRCMDRESRIQYELLNATARIKDRSHKETWDNLTEFIQMQQQVYQIPMTKRMQTHQENHRERVSRTRQQQKGSPPVPSARRNISTINAPRSRQLTYTKEDK